MYVGVEVDGLITMPQLLIAGQRVCDAMRCDAMQCEMSIVSRLFVCPASRLSCAAADFRKLADFPPSGIWQVQSHLGTHSDITQYLAQTTSDHSALSLEHQSRRKCHNMTILDMCP